MYVSSSLSLWRTPAPRAWQRDGYYIATWWRGARPLESACTYLSPKLRITCQEPLQEGGACSVRPRDEQWLPNWNLEKRKKNAHKVCFAFKSADAFKSANTLSKNWLNQSWGHFSRIPFPSTLYKSWNNPNSSVKHELILKSLCNGCFFFEGGVPPKSPDVLASFLAASAAASNSAVSCTERRAGMITPCQSLSPNPASATTANLQNTFFSCCFQMFL